jgi:hypothetical protein
MEGGFAMGEGVNTVEAVIKGTPGRLRGIEEKRSAKYET